MEKNTKSKIQKLISLPQAIELISSSTNKTISAEELVAACNDQNCMIYMDCSGLKFSSVKKEEKHEYELVGYAIPAGKVDLKWKGGECFVGRSDNETLLVISDAISGFDVRRGNRFKVNGFFRPFFCESGVQSLASFMLRHPGASGLTKHHSENRKNEKEFLDEQKKSLLIYCLLQLITNDKYSGSNRRLGQGAVTQTILEEFNLPGLGERNINALFAEANKSAKAKTSLDG